MNADIQTSTFSPSKGQGAKEYHSVIRIPETGHPFREQVQAVASALRLIASRKETELRFVRIFLSDPANQQNEVAEALSGFNAPVSFIGQPPLDGTKIAAWAYSSDIHYSSYTSLWSACISSDAKGPEAQMYNIFKNYEAGLTAQNMTLTDNCIRTWIFVHDVDVNYGHVVKGRRDYFDTIGLTADTHYISSTGIEGRNCDINKLVTMDAFSIQGLDPSQIQFLQAKTHLCPTSEYGVTFERGTAVHYGDRTQLFISGTASIDHKGNVLHIGDVRNQTERMLDNIDALLAEGGADLSDIAVAIVYLRDTADIKAVKEVINSRCPSLNAEFVLAAVCRSTWLVEMECIAITSSENPQFKNF